MDTEGLVSTDSTSEARACELGSPVAGALGWEIHRAPVRWETLRGSGEMA